MLDFLRLSSWPCKWSYYYLILCKLFSSSLHFSLGTSTLNFKLTIKWILQKNQSYLEKVAQCLSQYSRTRGKFSNFYSKFLKLSSTGKKLLGENTDIFIGPRNLIQFMRQLVRMRQPELSHNMFWKFSQGVKRTLGSKEI